MHCAISGEAPQEPVISTKSGHIYEKRLITKALENNKGVDPVTQEPLAQEDLLAVKANPLIKPRPAAAASVPGVLQLLQNEWDSVMLESYALKKQLESTRQELAHALYQHDAACRVIARLIQERDEARESLANYKSRKANDATEESMDVEKQLSEEVKAKIHQRSSELSKERKKRAQSTTLATPEEVKEFTVQQTANTHSPSQPGVTAVDVHPTQANHVLTGGVDGAVVLFDASSKKIQKTYKGHGKKVTSVQFHPTEEFFLSASADKTVRVWSKDSDKAVYTATHDNAVTGVSLQPTGEFFVASSLDQSWSFHDFKNGSSLLKVSNEKPLATVQFHPDGTLFGTGEEGGVVRIWDIRSANNVVNVEDHKSTSTSISFSENGYYLATAAEDNTVKLWDLRHQKTFHELEIPADFGLTSVSFDYSGKYLLVTGAHVRVYTGKNFALVGSYTKHTASVTDAAWGPDAKTFVSVSLDKSLNVWGTSQ